MVDSLYFWRISVIVRRLPASIVSPLMFALIIPISFAFSAPQSHSSLSAYDLTNPELISQGKELFAQNCAVGYCHGSAGRSGRGPRLRAREWDKNYLFRVSME